MFDCKLTSSRLDIQEALPGGNKRRVADVYPTVPNGERLTAELVRRWNMHEDILGVFKGSISDAAAGEAIRELLKQARG